MKKRTKLAIYLSIAVALSVILGFACQRFLFRSFSTTLGFDSSHSNLKADLEKASRLAFAIQFFNDTQRVFPFSSRTKEMYGNNVSWRCFAAGYYGDHSLYNFFRPQQPWDSEENLKAVKWFDKKFGLSNGNLLSGIQSGVDKLKDISDGVENTIMLIENPTVSSKFWMQPNDPTIDQAIDFVMELKRGESLIGATYDCQSIRILSPLLTGVSRQEVLSAFVPNDGIEFDLSKLQ